MPDRGMTVRRLARTTRTVLLKRANRKEETCVSKLRSRKGRLAPVVATKKGFPWREARPAGILMRLSVTGPLRFYGAFDTRCSSATLLLPRSIFALLFGSL